MSLRRIELLTPCGANWMLISCDCVGCRAYRRCLLRWQTRCGVMPPGQMNGAQHSACVAWSSKASAISMIFILPSSRSLATIARPSSTRKRLRPPTMHPPLSRSPSPSSSTFAACLKQLSCCGPRGWTGLFCAADQHCLGLNSRRHLRGTMLPFSVCLAR